MAGGFPLFQRHPPAVPADSRFGRPAYGVGYHDPKGHMALPHCGARTSQRASLVQGPLAPDGLFGPRFSRTSSLSVRIVPGSGRFSQAPPTSRPGGSGVQAGPSVPGGPPPTPAPVPQQQQQPQPPPQTGRAPRTGKFRKLAPTFSFPIKEKSKDRSAERQYMVPKERYSLGHLRPTLVVRSSMLPLSPPQPGGCRVAVGRRVHMASGSPASKKRRPLEPWIQPLVPVSWFPTLSPLPSGVVQGIRGYTAYTHLFFSQHCVYPLLNPPRCAPFSSICKRNRPLFPGEAMTHATLPLIGSLY
ncbi:unnamed protein product [Gadus morhua 'NCC']